MVKSPSFPAALSLIRSSMVSFGMYSVEIYDKIAKKKYVF